MSNPLRIAIAGLGTVGCGTIKLLQENADVITKRAGRAIEVVAISARSEKDRGVDVSGMRYETDARVFATDDDVDVVVELIGGDEGVARELVTNALKAGKHVVTANKALIAKHGAELNALAEQHHVVLAFEAAVAGGTPILAMIREGLAANRIKRVSGILNGTCNYILTEMEKHGRTYEDMLAEAESLGYLEADPRLDIDGIDTAHKLAILAALAFGKSPNLDAVQCTGISHVTLQDVRYAHALGYRIKLIGATELQGDKVVQTVSPTLVALDSPLASVDSSYNAIEVHGDHVERIFLQGRGAGPGPTASSVVADLVATARGVQPAAFSVRGDDLQPLEPADLDALESSYYLRLHVADKPGVLAKIAELCTSHAVSVEELRQEPTRADDAADIVITTHETTLGAMKEVIAKLASLETNLQPPVWLRIEEN